MQAVDKVNSPLDLPLRVTSVLGESRAPRGALGELEGNVGCGSAQLRGAVLEHVVVDEGELKKVGGEEQELGVSLGSLAEALEEGALGRDGEAELELGKDELLHLEDLLTGVSIVADVDIVAHFGRVDLLVLGGNHERGDSNELEALAGNLLDGQEAVENVDSEEKSLVAELEL